MSSVAYIMPKKKKTALDHFHYLVLISVFCRQQGSKRFRVPGIQGRKIMALGLRRFTNENRHFWPGSK